ncbi:MAG TPA: 2-oxoglutarate dehydrogenase complex dihydrolipoyllysine-residue succinyltransferase [Phycisphaerae bacterium]|nr:2-oxoglutarate dehydrogenase complex dihydrolipoyllysine-residue succinyltransferase [Phycisphaerae bacterium]HOJ75210.1 2-oxoglutarate dehydrogenase complex dihydrolipoyllysine-residue succinyltransferase [Phycisphaerae bacterium]HOM52439.1 2-oxoglutarate dehydrogenase complex dihydrolipoyllysine-residue succinyltransferase [Phycisphaerae bacterium]HOQ85913.1 2-oxoglutarate dehydrogenase complex dihydrolipoyllysine-residue succinyltransferase [Phycisphaerae bacterium]HPP27713.1 2-oxoglutara
MAVELKVPQAGESVQEVQVGEWRKADGDYVEVDEILVEIETDKAAMELPAPVSGKLIIHKRKGEIAKPGDVLAAIDESAVRPQPAPGGPTEPAAAAPVAQPPAQPGVSPAREVSAMPRPGDAASPVVMPAARRAMAEAGLEPAQVQPTGPGGRILKQDVQRAREKAPAKLPIAGATPPAAAAAPEPVAAPAGLRQEEAVPMSMLRRRVAQRLVEAQQTAAMLTTFNEADLSAVLQLRKEHNDAFEKKHGIKLGFMSFFVKAAIDALKTFPQLNAEIRGNDIVYRNYFDIGVAVSTDRGLVVPVLRNAELMSFAQIEQAIADMARRARENKLTLDELEGGTFTITNGGVFGSLLSTPILNPPQSGILGLHAIQERPVVREGQIVIRPMMYVALTYDHRIVDGREAVLFLRRIKDCVENPARMLLEA